MAGATLALATRIIAAYNGGLSRTRGIISTHMHMYGESYT